MSHPGTSTWLRDTDDARQLWERPHDVSRVISHLLSDDTFAPRIHPKNIFMGGHSLGGWTAVWLTDGLYDGDKVKTDCATDPSELICKIGEMWRIAKTEEDIVSMEQDLSDPRIKAIAVFDLGGTQTFAPETLAIIKTPLLVIGAPKPSMGSLDLYRESRALVASLPKDNVRYIEPASLTRFDFLGVFTERGTNILEDEVRATASCVKAAQTSISRITRLSRTL
ncbi:hypothetical protein [Planktotalea sp.]|uniref:alpha/beta hydrolase family protein n=1 Tax=Planktotalea sp. TaxID=2029877 RepID=UPI0025F8E9BA|nr:hypothetical protein [Planktotalea sp.]